MSLEGGGVFLHDGVGVEVQYSDQALRPSYPGRMLPLGLSMLWESTDPTTALRERFGFADLDAVAVWVTDVLGETWGLAVTSCPRVVISDHNAVAWATAGRGDLVVKWSHDPDRFASLEASTRLLRVLAESDVPVAAPVTTRGGDDRAIVRGPSGDLSVMVLPELRADWLDVRDHAAVRSAGACLAQVHQALGGVRHPPSAAPADDLPARIDHWLTHADHALAPAGSRRLRALLAHLPELDDEPQLVHNDYRAANVLVRSSRVVGVLDLDEVTVEHRVGDLAKASVYLGTLFTDWSPTPSAVRRQLRAGYESVRPLSPVEARWLDALVLWQALMAIPGRPDPAAWAAAL